MRRWAGAAIAALLAAGCGTRASGAGAAAPDTVFAEDFETGNLAAWADGVDTNRQHVILDSAFARSGRRYLAVTYVAGGDGGWLTRFFPPGYDSLYASYYVRFPAA